MKQMFIEQTAIFHNVDKVRCVSAANRFSEELAKNRYIKNVRLFTKPCVTIDSQGRRYYDFFVFIGFTKIIEVEK